ncbi:hypothetical protein CDL15_Pgr005910 [Punica granatum]|uniref:Uncharacterized protein n=1 Tax=Punica granatum TaxID=22663 RepID=A0A218WI84_PUNGR|nr:hypothetical protein CDL15_Pgr005910 [Punica granatum]
MQRLGVSRSSEDLSIDFFLPSMGSSPLRSNGAANETLPLYAPISEENNKKENPAHQRPLPGERAVHLIPLVLILCALILWLFSQ